MITSIFVLRVEIYFMYSEISVNFCLNFNILKTLKRLIHDDLFFYSSKSFFCTQNLTHKAHLGSIITRFEKVQLCKKGFKSKQVIVKNKNKTEVKGLFIILLSYILIAHQLAHLSDSGLVQQSFWLQKHLSTFYLNSNFANITYFDAMQTILYWVKIQDY